MRHIITSVMVLAGAAAWMAGAVLGAEGVASGKQAIGSVVAIKGNVQAVDAKGVGRALKIKSPIYKDDTIKTGKRGRVQLMFPDGTMISLARNSSMKIAEYEYKPEQGKGKMTTEVTEGVFRVKGGKITKIAPDEFKTKTPTATIGIRGSFYGGALIGVGKWLKVAFLGGKGITVTNNHGMVEITTPQFGTTVLPGQAPADPSQFSPEDLAGLDPLAGVAGDPTNPEGGDGSAGGGDNPTGAFAGNFSDGDGSGDDMGGDLGDDALGGLGGDTLGGDDFSKVVGGIVENGLQSDVGSILTDETLNKFQISGRYIGSVLEGGIWAGLISGDRNYKDYLGAATGPGWSIPFQFNGVPVNGIGTYTGWNRVTIAPGRIVPLSIGTIFNDHTYLQYDNLGEFLVWQSSLKVPTEDDPIFGELGFAGRETLTGRVPTEGQALYQGLFVAASTDIPGGETYADTGKLDVWVNYGSRSVVGFTHDDIQDPDHPDVGFVYGHYAAGDVSGIKIIHLEEDDSGGDDDDDDDMDVTVGAADFGKFYGRAAQGLGITISGTSTETESGTVTGTVQVAAGMHKTQQTAAPQGAELLMGFAACMAEDIDNQGYTGAMASQPGEFGLLLNHNAGTLNGSLSAANVGGSLRFDGLQVGGANGSAVVNSRTFVAELGGDTGVVDYMGTDGALKSVGGNVLWTAPLSEQWWSPDVTWGYWAANFKRPSSSDDMQVVPDEGFWVAGQPTPAAEVQALLDQGNLVGDYHGGAMCVEQVYDGMGNSDFRTLKGWSQVVVNFKSSALSNVAVGDTTMNIAAKGVGGQLNFQNKIKIEFESSASQVTNTGFALTDKVTKVVTDTHGNESGSIQAGNKVNGRFYGPGARSIGGDFKIKTTPTGSDTKHYAGVFGGQR